MPYISQPERTGFESLLSPLLEHINNGEEHHVSEGELNYIITTIVDTWLGETPSYFALNSAIGVLECVKLELYRRIVAPYEDKKCMVNGDAYQKRKP